MLTGIALHEDGRTERFDTVERVGELRRDARCRLWVDIEAPQGPEVRTLAKLFNLDPEAVDDSLRGDPPPQIGEFDDSMYMLVYGSVGRDGQRLFEPKKLAIFMGSHWLITVHEKALRVIDQQWERSRSLPTHLLHRGVDQLLHTIIDTIVDNLFIVARGLDERLDALEERSLEPEPDQRVLADLSRLRDEVRELRRITATQRELLLPLARGEFDYIDEDLQGRFIHVQSHLTAAIEMADSLREICTGIRENYNAALANRLNAIMKTLTLFATVMLPLSFVAGLYGMNVPIPGSENAWMFWELLAAMLVGGAAMYLFFKFRKWV